MKLPSHILKQVKWFECYFEPRWGHGLASRFVLHFAPWWKPRQTIWINGVVVQETDTTLYKSPDPSAAELLAQLKTQCPDQA